MTTLYGHIVGEQQSEPKNNLYNLLIDRIIDHEARPLSTISKFWNNLNESKKMGGLNDKFHHANANFQAGQFYDPKTALLLSTGRELWDLLKKNTWAKNPNTTFQEVYKDGRQDLEADNYGLMQGLLHPFSDSNILDKQWLNNLNRF